MDAELQQHFRVRQFFDVGVSLVGLGIYRKAMEF